MIQKEKIGLVLSGGGYRGVAHLGVIKALIERNITPDFISGTSAGAIVGSLYAAGLSWEEIYALFKETDIFTLKNYAFQKAGLIDGSNFVDLFQQVFPENSFEALKIPLFIGTTDLIEAKTRFYFEGELILPLIASASAPGIFSPISYQGRLLCDGGVTNNLPIEPLIPLSDKIIGVYVNPLQAVTKEDLLSTRAVLERSYYIMRNAISKKNINQCDVLIAPEKLSTYGIMSKSNLNKILEMGYEEACLKLDNFQKN